MGRMIREMHTDNTAINVRWKALYVFGALAVLCIFILLLYKPIENSYHEHDMLWMLPVTAAVPASHSALEGLRTFLYNPTTASYGEPWMNTYLWFVYSVFGFQVKYFILTGIVLHIICSALLYLMLRELKIDFRVAILSALTFFSLFVHFGYYLFPMNSHHLFVMLFSMLVMWLYFGTDRRISEGRSWKPFFWAAIFANILASFSQVTILILPIGVLTHIMISSKYPSERLRRFDLWLPLFIAYLGYPLMRMLYKGFPHLRYFFRMADTGPASPLLFPVVFVICAVALFIFRIMLKVSCRYDFGKLLKPLLYASLTVYIMAFIAALGRTDITTPSGVKLYDWLSPLNILRPVALMLWNLIFPVKAALSVNSAQIFHVMSRHCGSMAFTSAVIFTLVFLKDYLIKYKGLIILTLFYAVSLRYTRIETSVLPSRHFIYVTPLFSVIFCSVCVGLLDRLKFNNARYWAGVRNIILVAFFVLLCAQNIIAMRLELFRGRLVNTFITYDYIRTSSLIRDDMEASGKGGRIIPSDIYIDGVEPMADSYGDYWTPLLDRHLKFDIFRYVFAQTLGRKDMFNVNVNERFPDTSGNIAYKIEGDTVIGPGGYDIDVFKRYIDEGAKELGLKNNKKAADMFAKAIKLRPFLLRYILSDCDLKDLAFITNNRDLRKWTADIIEYSRVNGVGDVKNKVVVISAIIEDEISDYIICLCYAAYLDEQSGNSAEGDGIFSGIFILNGHHDEVLSLLDRDPAVISDKDMLKFLHDRMAGKVSASKPAMSALPVFLAKLVFEDFEAG